jgi:hypothetical protein
MHEPIVMLLDDTSELRWVARDSIELWANGARVRELDHFETQFIAAAWRAGYASGMSVFAPASV